MANIIGKIDVTKIDKIHLYKGKKGTYLDLALIETPNSDYGDYMIVQNVSKEERKAGKKGPIIGNATVWGDKKDTAAARPQAESRPEPSDDDCPF